MDVVMADSSRASLSPCLTHKQTDQIHGISQHLSAPTLLNHDIAMSHQLVWFKRDLRVQDHEPLSRAVKAGPCLCLYIYENELITAADFDGVHLNFINESLSELREALRSRGGDLVVRAGDAVSILRELCEKYDVRHIWAHEETFNGLSFRRDREVRAWSRSSVTKLTELPSNGIVRRLSSRDGWSRLWQETMRQTPIPPPRRIQPVPNVEPGSILPRNAWDTDWDTRHAVQHGGEPQAHQELESFLMRRGTYYRSEMSSPVTAYESCSRLSPYLAFGNISIRTVHQRTLERVAELRRLKKEGESKSAPWLRSLSSFQGRLRWHCHFIQKLEDEPQIEFENINRAFDGLREAEFSREYFEAWCQGRTGYPLVDACMRALKETGWINFRMRAMLVSFASYHLWLHWREPALHLARLFLDYEPGIHYSQIQMQSGVTGINTVRIYSPIKQVKDQDPSGTFIRRWVPELMDVPDKHLAEPHKMNGMEQSLFGCQIGRDYPSPVVDHATASKRARDRIFEVRKTAEAKAEAKRVYLKHGSRRRPRQRRSAMPEVR